MERQNRNFLRECPRWSRLSIVPSLTFEPEIQAENERE